ncbi:hypothetical protein CIHG_07189 [Coccidioides immitis H538.4]|uniref:Uncharacterized protein n=3 Tax=Coccidioides immitis TaxID=5501 RepID=A0A0J8R9Z7_COCIT|nr:hypothetical protein CIRG_09092 [Coccidioides immitis RMSCC 2394]KMU81250.1 hypothetical protein CISG_02627 [Coccidioides immitis RMSCC 3703]KMU89383.1 hypothetical protein CIHG_07189 [Coccidioides immitis H538.4]
MLWRLVAHDGLWFVAHARYSVAVLASPDSPPLALRESRRDQFQTEEGPPIIPAPQQFRQDQSRNHPFRPSRAVPVAPRESHPQRRQQRRRRWGQTGRRTVEVGEEVDEVPVVEERLEHLQPRLP